jgi:hypothetical protein
VASAAISAGICGIAASATSSYGSSSSGSEKAASERSETGRFWMRGSTFWMRVRGHRGTAAGGGRARLLLRRIAQDDLPRVGQLLALQDGLDDVGVDVSVVAFHPHADRFQLEDQILVRDLHHAREVLDPDLSHTFL